MRRRKLIGGVLSCIAMLIIIIDGKSAVSSIRGGVDLCLRTVIPALFPFFILSGIMNSCFLGQTFRFLAPLQRLCKLPAGTESILLIGLFSGYPVGAQLVSEAYAGKCLSKENAMRMLGFCSNAGPAFIFGMLATAFTNPVIPWVLWGTHIVSGLTVGWLLPGGATDTCALKEKEVISVAKALQNATKNIATVCGWVILFRLMLDFCKGWFLWLLPDEIQVLIAGVVELTNGCVMLQQLESEGTRFILAAAMLPCICGVMCGITPPLGLGMYAGMSLAESDFSKTFKNNLFWVFGQFAMEVIVLMGWLPILGLS